MKYCKIEFEKLTYFCYAKDSKVALQDTHENVEVFELLEKDIFFFFRLMWKI